MLFDIDHFRYEGAKIAGTTTDSGVLQERQFLSFFGVKPKVCELAWQIMEENIPDGMSTKHLLWGLLLLKVYSTETVLSSFAGVTEKTFRKWSWESIKALSRLDMVRDIFNAILIIFVASKIYFLTTRCKC